MRDHWLWQIQLALRERGVWAEIRSVAYLRQLYPNLPRPLNLEALERLAGEVATADLEEWATVPPKDRKADRPNARTSKLTYEEIRARRSSGESLQSIAQAAGLSRERVRQICKGTLSKIIRHPHDPIQTTDNCKHDRDLLPGQWYNARASDLDPLPCPIGRSIGVSARHPQS